VVPRPRNSVPIATSSPSDAVVVPSTSGMVRSATSSSDDESNSSLTSSVQKHLSKTLVGALAALSFSFLPLTTQSSPLLAPPPAHAAESTRVVGQIKGSGLVFKDTLQVEAFQDPKVKGVYLYVSNFQIPITERLGGNFFNDPSSASVACARTGKVAIASNIAKGPAGEEVFEESKSLLFKTLRVIRIYDEESNTVVYVSFNTRLDKNEDANKSRFKSSLCAINLDNEAAPVAPTLVVEAVAEPVSP